MKKLKRYVSVWLSCLMTPVLVTEKKTQQATPQPNTAAATETSSTAPLEAPVILMPRVDVVDAREEMSGLPGSVTILDQETLKESRVFDVQEALRKASGVHVRNEEEGCGLRPNIGIRGLNPTRSTKVTLLENGGPLAYVPYDDNASYYYPPLSVLTASRCSRARDNCSSARRVLVG